MARIGIDGTRICVPMKGLARYLTGFLDALAGSPGSHQYFIFLRRGNNLPDLSEHPQFHYVPVSFPFGLAWELAILPKFVGRLGLNLLHTPLERGLFFRGVPVVLYLFEIPDHRMQLERRSAASPYQKFSRGISKILFSRALKKTALIMTSSQFTRREIEKKYGVPEKKIALVYPGCGGVFRPASEDEISAIRAKRKAPAGYVLHFSSDDPRDNSGVVLEAYAKAARRLANPPLLFIKGSDRIRESVMARCKTLRIEEATRFFGYQSDQELLELYQGASVYVDPSLFEGFGFQVAEAMACGIPVITSDSSSLPELAGLGGITAPPDDVEAFADAMLRILADAGLRTKLRQDGLAQSRRFSWPRHVEETLGVYDRVLAGARIPARDGGLNRIPPK